MDSNTARTIARANALAVLVVVFCFALPTAILSQDFAALRARRGVGVDDSTGWKVSTGNRADSSSGAGSLRMLNSNTPRITADGRVMFFNSNRYNGRPWARRRANSTDYDSDIYYVERVISADGRTSWGEAVNLGPEVNTGQDDAIEAISPSGSVVYFSSLANGWYRKGGPFYRADIDGSGWHNVRGLGGGITSFFLSANRFTVYGSAINAEGTAFYFATTAHSTTGQHQIWVSYLRDGTWSAPENLGESVNAAGGSFAPFIAADGKTLYFASGRSGGYGGDDIYVTVRDGSTWAPARNLGSGVNTPANESFLAIQASGDRVYLSRDSGNVADQAAIVDATIRPEFLPTGVVLLTGTIVDAETKAAVDATITIEDLETGAMVLRTSGAGVDDRFAVILAPGRDYGIAVSAPGYGFQSQRYTVPANTESHEATSRIELHRIDLGVRFALNNIFFDYKSDTLRRESRPELDRLIELMRAYPTMTIEVAGHTDDIGSDAYNNALSQRRAEAVLHYMTSVGGVEPKRVVARGFGARRAKAAATDEERQKNRVVEFAVKTL